MLILLYNLLWLSQPPLPTSLNCWLFLRPWRTWIASLVQQAQTILYTIESGSQLQSTSPHFRAIWHLACACACWYSKIELSRLQKRCWLMVRPLKPYKLSYLHLYLVHPVEYRTAPLGQSYAMQLWLPISGKAKIRTLIKSVEFWSGSQ